jgi:hypothetical protein
MKLHLQDRQLVLETSFPRARGLPKWPQSRDCCNIREESVSRSARMWTKGLRGKDRQLLPHAADIAAPLAFSGYAGIYLGMNKMQESQLTYQ